MSTDQDGLGSLVERMYQGELAQHARERNTILAVDTGTGKTLIAAMVIRWKLAMDRMNTPDRGGSSRKIAMFLVPKVPLVEQQRKVMDDNTDKDIIVKGYTGAMGVDFWDRTAWQKEFNEADILVMTPQIFLNVLRHAHWSLSQVSMIVFDEVHNCKGRSPEAQIMNDHYHTFQPANARPKILGLTASPVFNHKNPITALHQMERLTDCKVVVVRQNADELTKFTFQAKDRIIDYATSPSVWPVYENPSLWAELHAKKLLPNDLLFPKKDRRKEQLASEWYRALADRYRSTILALGPFAADLFVLVHMTTALEGVRNDLDPLYPETIDQDAKRRASLNETLAVIEKHQPRLSSDGDELKHEWLSPRLLALKALLLEHHNVPEFRGIIFCYERQYATTLSLLLPRLGVPGIRAGPLVGHGQNACAEPTKVGMRGMAFRAQENIVEDFRRGDLNLLIATSVAEEGLDFPLCSFVCRFDPPRTLPQYIQSRGRARKEGSSFVIMLEKGPSLDRGRLEALQLSEGRLKKMYGRNMDTKKGEADASDDYDEDDTFEGRFTVEKTGASITPAGSIALLENLCSLIPVDPHTNPLRPKYNMRTLMPLGDFRCSVLLPAALPIPRENLLLKSDPEARSKKAAKRSAAFNAVRMLYKLGVFDDYLLPLRREKGDVAEDVDGKSPIDVTGIEPMMDVLVHDAWGDMWQEDAQLYVHRLEISGETGMGLVCAVCLPEYEGMMVASRREKPVRVFKGVAVEMDNAERTKALALMQEYTKRGIRYSITRKGLLDRNLCLFLVPLDHHGHPDYDAMERCIRSPASQDWSTIDLSGATDVLVSTIYDTKVSKLIRRRSDVQVAECIAKSTYLTKATENLKKLGRDIPEDDLILECREVLQATSTDFREPSRQKAGILAEHSILLPQSLCQWVNFHQETIAWYLLLPPLANLLQSVHRARLVQKMLQIPLSLDRTIEAFTVPSASASFSNQRLETLGDAFLKVATSIHVFKKFPYKHEGQLTVLKMNSISNRYLLGRGHVRDLPSYINIEPNNQAKWRLTTNLIGRVDGAWMAKRKIPRRSVQDCMEALLGVAWLSGGVKTALAAGTELGLCFGGSEAWWDRYPSDEMEVCTGSPFPTLEDTLGYQFKNKSLLLEALTHPSFAKGGPCYQRLEFLGDAVLDLVVMDHFFKKFPDAGSGKLTRARARCVCAQTLSAIATKKLDVHKNIFCDSISLVKDMTRTAQQVFDGMSFAEIIDSIWKLDVPKALSDVVEALLGAVLIDCGWRYDVVEEVIMKLFKEILEYVDPDMPADPATEFMLWVGRHGCTQVKYRRCSSSQEIAPRKDHCFVVVHDVDIGPATIIEPKKTAVMARASAALQARLLLSDPHSEFAFDKLCTCTKKEKVHNVTLYQAAADLVSDLADLDPETTEGFAIDAQLQLAKMEEMNADETVDEDTADDGEEEIMSGPAPDREDTAAKT